jgi:hypothetical protein
MRNSLVGLALGLALGSMIVGPGTANAVVQTTPRLITVFENVDVAPAAEVTTAFFQTGDCRGVSILVNLTNSITSPLVPRLELGIADGAGGTLRAGVVPLNMSSDDQGTYMTWNAGQTVFAPRMRVIFHGNEGGVGTHITKAVLFCQQ